MYQFNPYIITADMNIWHTIRKESESALHYIVNVINSIGNIYTCMNFVFM